MTLAAVNRTRDRERDGSKEDASSDRVASDGEANASESSRRTRGEVKSESRARPETRDARIVRIAVGM